MDKPIVRGVEAFPIDQEGETYVCLRDPTGLAAEPILLGMGAYFLVTLFDGEKDLRELQAAFKSRFGEILELEKISELTRTLDDAHFLDSPSFRDHERRTREEFRAQPDRPAALAGLCYAAEPMRLREELSAYFDPPEGPGRMPARKPGEAIAGLIAPHIDPRRGAAAYAHAYAELMTHEPPELVIILGTSHYGAGPALFSATRKNYLTPFGPVETDREFIDRLAARYHGGDLFADEFLHRGEHSIEFQALFLAYSMGVRGYTIAPILVSSFHEMVASGRRPADDPRVGAFVEALSALIAAESRRVLVLAGVDFAHVGRKFGDPFVADAEVADRVKREDLALIETIKHGDPDAFFTAITADHDARNICGLAPIYTLLELLRGRDGRLLKYGIAMEPQTESCVSFASIAIN